MYKWNPFTNNLDEKGDWFFNGNTLGSKKTIGSIDDQDFGIITNNSERLTVLKDGNVGIGTTAPGAKLGVLGTVLSSKVVYGDPAGITGTASDGLRFSFNPSGSNLFGFGLTGPISTKYFNWYATGAINGGGHIFFNCSTEVLRIDTNGNVGIGTTTPTAKLDVAGGNINIDNTTYANQNGVITKNGSRFIHNFNYGNNGTVTTDGNNTFIGINAGNFTMGSTATAASQASYNTGVGVNSLYSNTTGNSNTANGYQSLNSNTTGSYNTANGVNSLYSNTTGNSNTANGAYSLLSNATGNNNTALGIFSGRFIADKSTGALNSNNSVFLGYRTSPLADNQTNQIVIGYDAIGAGSNSVTLGNDSITTTALKGNVGIGTTTPNAKLQVVGTARIGEYTNNFTEFEANGTLKMNGTAIVYDDVNTSVAAAKLPAAGYPDWETFTTNTNAYTFKINDFADLGTIEIPHSYKEGSDLEVHLHLATNGTNNATERKVKYIIYYTYGISDNGSNQFITEASLTAELTIPANQLDKSTYYLSMGKIPGTGIKIGTQLKMRIKRIAGTGTEPVNNPFLGQVGVHFQKDTIGSRTMTSK